MRQPCCVAQTGVRLLGPSNSWDAQSLQLLTPAQHLPTAAAFSSPWPSSASVSPQKVFPIPSFQKPASGTFHWTSLKQCHLFYIQWQLSVRDHVRGI